MLSGVGLVCEGSLIVVLTRLLLLTLQVLAEIRAQELHEFRLLRCFLIVLGPGKSLSCRMPLSFLNHYVLLIRDIGLDVRQRKLLTRQ